jgi:uncharacterized protein with FMN-binding domain
LRRTIVTAFVAVVVVLTLFAAKLVSERASGRSGHDPADSRPSRSSAAATPSAPNATPTSTLPPGNHQALGDVASTDYGPVQVSVTVQGGRIVAVTAVQLPHADPMDTQLSKPAAARLAQAVLEAQSAQVDTISGATYTSQGYLLSLQSALDHLGG